MDYNLPKQTLRNFLLLTILAIAACGTDRPTVTVVAASAKALPTVIRNVSILDVRNGSIENNKDVWLKNERIEKIEPANTTAVPKDVQVINGEGATVVPGLIDMHGHISASSTPIWALESADPEANLQAYLYAGVTTVFDPGDSSGEAYERRQKVAAGELMGPRIFTAGPIHTTTEGHPIALVRAIAPAWIAWLIAPGVAEVIATEEDANAAVKSLVDAQADAMKIVVDSIPLDSAVMPAKIVKAVVDAAQSQGLPVVAHIGTGEDAIITGEAGVSLWVHTVYKVALNDEQIEKIASFGIPMVVTIEVMDQYGRGRKGARTPIPMELETVPSDVMDSLYPIPDDFNPGELSSWLERQAEIHEAGALHNNVRRLHKAGVTILAGSDTQSGVFPGAGLHRELAQLVKAGLSPAEAIRGATIDAAAFLSKGKPLSFGVVETGKIADLLIVNGDPTQDVGVLQDVRYLVQGGKVIERTSILAL